MMCKETYNYCLVPGKDMELEGTVLRQQTKINSHLGIAFSNIIEIILDNYSHNNIHFVPLILKMVLSKNMLKLR